MFSPCKNNGKLFANTLETLMLYLLHFVQRHPKELRVFSLCLLHFVIYSLIFLNIYFIFIYIYVCVHVHMYKCIHRSQRKILDPLWSYK